MKLDEQTAERMLTATRDYRAARDRMVQHKAGPIEFSAVSNRHARHFMATLGPYDYNELLDLFRMFHAYADEKEVVGKSPIWSEYSPADVTACMELIGLSLGILRMDRNTTP